MRTLTIYVAIGMLILSTVPVHALKVSSNFHREVAEAIFIVIWPITLVIALAMLLEASRSRR